jgi:ABC-type lipoprotein release transport system permease subunit
MFMDTAIIRQLEGIENITNVSPRVETFAMASFGAVNKGIAVIGISPEKEAQKSNLPSRIVAGGYLSETDDGILIGEGLSKYLNANIGDTLALIGQGYHGASAAGLFPVRGILKLMTAEMDNGMMYMTIPSAQNFIDMPDGYSGILISITDNNKLDEVIQVISFQLSVVSEKAENWELKTENYEVYSWHFTMERLLETAKSDEAFSSFIMFILYVIVGFGILGTIIMMTNERKREFCTMISLGMPRMRLATVVSTELLIMSLIGVLLAFVVTIPLTHWFAAHPIAISGEMSDTFIQFGMEPFLPMSVKLSIFIDQIITILVITLITMIYPAYKILKLKITNK